MTVQTSAKAHAKPKTPRDADQAQIGNLQKDPEDWVTGDEPMTAAQGSYLKTLCEETGEEFDGSLSKAQASERIDALRAKDSRITGQGRRSS